jgi:Domain of unknown function (DUF4224)
MLHSRTLRREQIASRIEVLEPTSRSRRAVGPRMSEGARAFLAGGARVIFLTKEELRELTKRNRSSEQVFVLRFMGIEHEIRPDGSVVLCARMSSLCWAE